MIRSEEAVVLIRTKMSWIHSTAAGTGSVAGPDPNPDP